MRRARLLIGICLGLAGASRAETPAQAEVSKLIQSGFDAMNRGDSAAFSRIYDPTAIIVDDTAPYVWTAPGALKAWQVSDAAWAKANGVSSVTCTLDKTVRNEVSGDRAYFIGHGGCTVVMKGVRNFQDGVWTFVLARRPEGWRAVLLTFAGEALAPR